MGEFSTAKVFFSESSEQGQRKIELSVSHRMICPKWGNLELPFRTSWENIQRFIAIHKEETVSRLASCQEGNEAAEEYASLQVMSPLELYAEGFLKGIFPKVLADYDPDNGFDMDVSLFLDDEDNPQFITEVFPRTAKGQMITDCCSVFNFDFPMVGKAGEDIYYAIMIFIIAERVEAGESEQEVLKEWGRHIGCWYITREDLISFFINKACFSGIETHTDEVSQVVEPGTVRSFEGVNLKGRIHYTTSK